MQGGEKKIRKQMMQYVHISVMLGLKSSDFFNSDSAIHFERELSDCCRRKS